jgi:multidrug efflux pump subunit AcrA (membrane-fusion protein)
MRVKIERTTVAILGTIAVVGGVAALLVSRLSSADLESHRFTVRVFAGPITQELLLAGIVTYREAVTLGPPGVGLRVGRVPVNVGAQVEAGTELIEFEQGRARTDIARKRTALASSLGHSPIPPHFIHPFTHSLIHPLTPSQSRRAHRDRRERLRR